jgi:hypothetical protein
MINGFQPFRDYCCSTGILLVVHGIPGERGPSVRSGGSEVAPAFGLRVLAAPLSLRRNMPGLAPLQPVPRTQSAGETGRTPHTLARATNRLASRPTRSHPVTPEFRDEPIILEGASDEPAGPC